MAFLACGSVGLGACSDPSTTESSAATTTEEATDTTVDRFVGELRNIEWGEIGIPHVPVGSTLHYDMITLYAVDGPALVEDIDVDVTGGAGRVTRLSWYREDRPEPHSASIGGTPPHAVDLTLPFELEAIDPVNAGRPQDDPNAVAVVVEIETRAEGTVVIGPVTATVRDRLERETMTISHGIGVACSAASPDGSCTPATE